MATRASSASANTQAGKQVARHHSHRREVVVKSQRVKTVNIHAHCIVPEA
tara:strand:- start:326 stop:475 length:150 start_codon:yes stop_codon:yes gene_type:complete